MRLTAITLEQCEIVRLWRNEILETLRTPYPLTKEMQEAFYRETVCNRNSPHRYYAIMDDKGLFVGMGGITHITWESRIGEISLIIDPSLREKGYGEKAVDLLLDAAFNQMGLNCVYGECYSCNEANIFWGHITNKYHGTGVMLRARKFWNGKFWDSLYFSIDADDFRKVRSC